MDMLSILFMKLKYYQGMALLLVESKNGVDAYKVNNGYAQIIDTPNALKSELIFLQINRS